MKDHNFELHELTTVYLLGRINLLESAIAELARICAQYMPPEGQNAIASLENALDEKCMEWGEKNKEASHE